MNDLKPVFLFYEIDGKLTPVCSKCKEVLDIKSYQNHKCEKGNEDEQKRIV